MKLFACIAVLLWQCHVDLYAAQIIQDCSNSLELLTAAQDSELVSAAKYMQKKYNETCHKEGTCTVEATNDIPTSTRDFTSLIGDVYTDMSQACDAANPGKGNTVCLVSNEVFDEDLKMVEVFKPVCFPADCSETAAHIRLVDPTPSNCSPNSNKCEILSSEILCPVNRIPTDTGTCETDANKILASKELVNIDQKLNAQMVRSCIGSLLGSDNELCSVSTTVEAIRKADYSSFVNTHESHLEYEEICGEVGGQSCTISATLINRESESFLSLNTYYVYIDYPVCLPYEDCVDGDVSAEDLALEIFKDSFQCSRNGSCEQKVSNISCKDREATSSSSPSTSPPSLRSGSPSSLPSSFHSSSPSIASTIVTTEKHIGTTVDIEKPADTSTDIEVPIDTIISEKPVATSNGGKPTSTSSIGSIKPSMSSNGSFLGVSWKCLVATICSLSWIML